MSEEAEQERKKREIFESMSPRRQQKILKKGYGNWDPFLLPKEPPFCRGGQDDGERDAGQRFHKFLLDKGLEQSGDDLLSLDYVEGAREICFSFGRDRSDRSRGMMDFCLWLSRQGDSDP